MRMTLCRFCFCLASLSAAGLAQNKSTLTIDDLFSYTAMPSAKLSPDGKAVVFVTTRADWKNNRFRDDLWLWRDGADNLIPIAQSGHDNEPAWSPDGSYVAFISDRKIDEAEPESRDTTGNDKDAGEKEIARVWIVSAAGGEAFPLYREPLKVHSFAWSKDGSEIFLSVPQPLTKAEEEAHRRDWKDVGRWRQDERGDVLLGLPLKTAVPSPDPVPVSAKDDKPKDDAPQLPKEGRIVTQSNYAIGEIAPSPDGRQIAFLTNSISGRLEHLEPYEIYLVERSASKAVARQLTHNNALERQLRWSKDSRQLHFGVFAASGNLEGAYRDVQGRLYSLDVASGQVERMGKDFTGSWTDFALPNNGPMLALGQFGTEIQVYGTENGKSTMLNGTAGSYAGLDVALNAPAILFRHSTINQPEQLFLAADAAHLASARQITHLNGLFAQRELPGMKPYRWKSSDGHSVEGVLLYPPTQSERKHLRMLTLIHGGPADADGNKFGADWYNWAMLAASSGWLVFEPNYRGSTGYGDEFMLGISPHIVSVPGKDILSGVDALVRDGIADADHLAIGGYSYGGYMTNWLVTQTTRFRSAVTGAGAVEHASNWGNDDLTFDDAWYLGGRPWEKPAIYQSEAALFQFDKVRTPIHDVIGADDVRVSASQGYLLERTLDALSLPHAFLTFPGEGHGLGKNPWHGYIKVREELKWLEHYDQASTQSASTP